MSGIEVGKSYVIMNVATKTVVDLDDGSSNPNQGVHGYEWKLLSNFDNQIWKIKDAGQSDGSQYYYFENKQSGNNLTLSIISHGMTEEECKLVCNPPTNHVYQQWQIQAHPSSQSWPVCYWIRNKIHVGKEWSGKTIIPTEGVQQLDLYAFNTSNGADITMYEANNKTNQVWAFIPVPE